MTFGKKGVLHGFESYLLQDDQGEPLPVYSVASGLDYPATGPEHAYLKDMGRTQYDTVDDQEAMEAFFALSRYEGIIPALESSHAVAYAMRCAREGKFGSILAVSYTHLIHHRNPLLSYSVFSLLLYCFFQKNAMKDSKNVHKLHFNLFTI